MDEDNEHKTSCVSKQCNWTTYGSGSIQPFPNHLLNMSWPIAVPRVSLAMCMMCFEPNA